MVKKINLKKIRIFISYPSDVRPLIKYLKQIIERLNLTGKIAEQLGFSIEVLDWRTHVSSQAGQPQDTILEEYPVEVWDIYIGIFWLRYGEPTNAIDPDTGERYKSGVEQEFKVAYKQWEKTKRPRIFFYRCTKAMELNKIDSQQFKLVDDFFKQLKPNGKYPTRYKEFKSRNEFGENVRDDLERYLFEINKK